MPYTEEDIQRHMEDVTIQFFDEDPDDDDMRAGDGWYFQFAGEDTWNGAWHSETEAEQEARDLVEDAYMAYDNNLEIFERPPAEGQHRYVVTFRSGEATYPYNRVLSWKQEDGTRLAIVNAKDEASAKHQVQGAFLGTSLVAVDRTPHMLSEFIATRSLEQPDLQPYCDAEQPATTPSP